MSYDEESVKKMNELPKESVKGLTGIVGVVVVLMVFGLASTVPEKTHGVVEKRDKNLLYVQNLKDVTKYVAFSNDKTLKPNAIKAFPYVVVGDTLTYRTHGNSADQVNNVTRIHSQKLADFIKERQKKQDGTYNQKIR